MKNNEQKNEATVAVAKIREFAVKLTQEQSNAVARYEQMTETTVTAATIAKFACNYFANYAKQTTKRVAKDEIQQAVADENYDLVKELRAKYADLLK